jgi:hypothetical protein
VKTPSFLVSLALVICGLWSLDRPASAAVAHITGTWELTIHYPAPDGDFTATYVLTQKGETSAGTYDGLHGPADVTGTIKGSDVTFTVTVQSLTTVTAQFSGTVTSATAMNGTVTGTHSSGTPMPWNAAKKP